MTAIFDFGVDCVNAVGRQPKASDGDVCRRRPECSAESIAFNDFASDRIRTTQHLRGIIEFAPANALPNACAAHGLTIQREGSEAVDLKLESAAEISKQFDVAAPFVSKRECAADADAVNRAETVN